MEYSCKFANHRIVIRGKKKGRDQQGNPTKFDGHKIEFADGFYKTDDPVEISYLRKHMKQWPGEIVEVDPVKMKHEREVHARARKIVERELHNEAVEKAVKEKKTIDKDESLDKDDSFMEK